MCVGGGGGYVCVWGGGGDADVCVGWGGGGGGGVGEEGCKANVLSSVISPHHIFALPLCITHT